MNIHQQIADLRGAIDALIVQYPELADDEAFRADMLEGSTDLHEVAQALVCLAQDAETLSDAIGARIDELLERMRRFNARRDAMRSLLLLVMEKAELKKLVLPDATLSVGYRKPAPVVTNEAALPDVFCKHMRRPDIASIVERYKADGYLPPGVSISNGKTFLTMRTK